MWKEERIIVERYNCLFCLKNSISHELLSEYLQHRSEISNHSLAKKYQEEYHQQFHVVSTSSCWPATYSGKISICSVVCQIPFSTGFFPPSAFLVNIFVNHTSFLKIWASLHNCTNYGLLKTGISWHPITVHWQREEP